MPRKKDAPQQAIAHVLDEHDIIPQLTGYEVRANRSNRGTDYTQSEYSLLTGELNNVSGGISPMSTDGGGSVSVKTAICLCQKAFWNCSIMRATLEMLTQFSNSKLFFRSKNRGAKTFYENWYKKIEGFALGEAFFFEWFRSGNVFIYKFNGELTTPEVKKLARAAKVPIGIKEIPLRYVILNPADIKCRGAASFINSEYFKVLNSYELERLKNPKTDEEKEFVETLTEEQRSQIKKGENPGFTLTSDRLTAVFNSKQPYEPLAVPPFFPVLYDIDLKLNFKKMEAAISRTADYMILLITAGEKDRDGATNNRLLQNLQILFQTESVGRVLVSDYTTEANFVLPDLNKILGPEKYKVVNEDIANGLMNIFWGEEKFANSMVKIKVFLERLRSAREAYLTKFLRPEMEKIAETLGFTEVPEVIFEEIDLRDEVEYMKIYARLAEVGLLTPEELFKSFESHTLPLIENSLTSQEEFKNQKEKGLYEPLIGGPKKEEGRPGGTKAPKKKKTVGPIGASQKYSLTKIGENVKDINDLLLKIEAAYREKHGIKRMSNKQKDMAWMLCEAIISSREKPDWEISIPEFLENPDLDASSDVQNIAAEHGLNYCLAAILKNSKI